MRHNCVATFVTMLGSCLLSQSAIGQQILSEPTKYLEQGRIEVRDPAFAALIDPQVKIEILAEGFKWSEGPVWRTDGKYLLFSDVPNNRIHQWQAGQPVSVYLDRSGFNAADRQSTQRQQGSNGLAIDRQGRLIVCDHGNRRIYRLEEDGTRTTLTDNFAGKRFNSPNDLVIHSNGDIYFTDPPYGLVDKSARELDFNGVFCLKPSGEVRVFTKALHRPNGIALSPDEKTLYVAQSHKPVATYTRFDVNQSDQPNLDPVTLYDATILAQKDPGLPDGMVVDRQGNLWATGPGGVLVISPQGNLLGRILTLTPTANCTFGEDGSTLFMTAGKYLLKVKTKAKGMAFD